MFVLITEMHIAVFESLYKGYHHGLKLIVLSKYKP